MQNVYITRNGKQIQLTVNEIMAAWVAWDAETRKRPKSGASAIPPHSPADCHMRSDTIFIVS